MTLEFYRRHISLGITALSQTYLYFHSAVKVIMRKMHWIKKYIQTHTIISQRTRSREKGSLLRETQPPLSQFSPPNINISAPVLANTGRTMSEDTAEIKGAWVMVKGSFLKSPPPWALLGRNFIYLFIFCDSFICLLGQVEGQVKVIACLGD